MITLLRRFRQRLLSDHKFSKYLLYAIGEIILVVIGILIALSINNRNEKQKQSIQEEALLKEMKENLLSDLADIRYNIIEDSATLYSNQLILKQLEEDLPYHDSLSLHYGRLPRSSTLVANASAYESLKNYGVNLISNDSLRAEITNLYSARYNYIDKILERTSNQFIWNQLNPLLLSQLKSKHVLLDAKPLNPEAILSLTTLEETIRWHIAIKEFVINLYKETEQMILGIINLIDTQLKHD